jgi:hypothetical protein
MQPSTTAPATESTAGFTVAPGRRRAIRLSTDSHGRFLGNLVDELHMALARLEERTGPLPEVKDIGRLVQLLDAMDGPPSRRRLTPVSLPATVLEAAGELGVFFEATGRPGNELFVADLAGIRVGVDLLLLALAGAGRDGRVRIEVKSDRLVTLEGGLDQVNPAGDWELRYGRTLLEAEGCRVLVTGAGDRYRLHLRIGR